MVYEMITTTLVGPENVTREFREFHKEAVKYLIEKYPDYQLELITGATGDLLRVAYLFKFESIADAEAFAKSRNEDEGYMALCKKRFDLQDKHGISMWNELSREFWTVAEG